MENYCRIFYVCPYFWKQFSESINIYSYYEKVCAGSSKVVPRKGHYKPFIWPVKMMRWTTCTAVVQYATILVRLSKPPWYHGIIYNHKTGTFRKHEKLWYTRTRNSTLWLVFIGVKFNGISITIVWPNLQWFLMDIHTRWEYIIGTSLMNKDAGYQIHLKMLL